MKKPLKIQTLISVCILVLVGLSSIQFYLIRNTYNLHKKEYLFNIKEEISPVVESPELESLKDSLTDTIKDLLFQKHNDGIKDRTFELRLAQFLDSINKKGNGFIDSHRKDYDKLNDVKLRFQFSEIIYSDKTTSDTVLRSSSPPLIYFGESLKGNEVYNFTFGNTITNIENEKDEKVNSYSISLKYAIDFDPIHLKKEVLFQMVWMLLAAIILLLAVVYLFYKVIKALILQKEIAEMKTDLANNISHELKTPLTSIALVTKSLKLPEVFNSPVKRTELLGILERQNNRIQHLIDHIMETTVLNVPQKSSVEIETLLKTIANDFPTDSHRLELFIHHKNISILTDPHLLERAIENLLKNAQKYSPSGSVITLKGTPANSGYEIEVKDQGIGISEINQSKVFEKFYRVPQGLVHNTKGLGLGLYLSQQIIESLGGKITVKSQPHKGSTFKISLPNTI